MQYSNEGNAKYDILDHHRGTQSRTTANKDGGNEISDERISETDAGVSWIFRRIVMTKGEPGDHAQVKWQVTKIVEYSGVDAVRLHDHRAIKNKPCNNHDDDV